ncbi:universal stress protein [Streptomyces sp. NPDC006285]|uniref:universal stress protein n=1 Tax=Streptomyces sp. NPDC006285 TaxID=3364742 RepID=UPI0036D0329D
MLRYVTTGIDSSTESVAAAHWAAREAIRRGVPLRLVHAWKWHPRPAPSIPADRSEHSWAEQTLDRTADSVCAAHPGLALDRRLVSGAAAAALLTEAERSELLVLGSRRLGGLAGFMTGSVSQRVVAGSTCPVVLVRSGEGSADEHLPAPDGVSPDEISKTPYRDVVLGLDIWQPCDELAEFAFTAARLRDTDLRVVHAFGGPAAQAAGGPWDPVPGPRAEPLAAREHTVIAVLRRWCEKFPEVSVTATVCEGRAATELVRASAGASLVVVGRRTRDGRFSTHLGPVAHAVLHHVGCPVTVVPHA